MNAVTRQIFSCLVIANTTFWQITFLSGLKAMGEIRTLFAAEVAQLPYCIADLKTEVSFVVTAFAQERDAVLFPGNHHCR